MSQLPHKVEHQNNMREREMAVPCCPRIPPTRLQIMKCDITKNSYSTRLKQRKKKKSVSALSEERMKEKNGRKKRKKRNEIINTKRERRKKMKKKRRNERTKEKR